METRPDSSISKLVQMSENLGRAFEVLRWSCYWLFRPPLNYRIIIRQMVEIGVNSLPVVSLVFFFVGMVLALQTGLSSQNILNEPLYIGTVLGYSLIKELGPVLTAVVVTGRVGSAMAAQLGTMKVTEQIDALYTLGTNPYKYLVVPRFWASFIMMPLLSLFASFVGILGGLLVAVYKLNIPSSTYYHDIVNFMNVSDIVHGLIKTFFFASLMVLVSCYKGFYTEGGAEGVGRSTTQAVVITMVWVLVSDYFLTVLLQTIGI